MPERIPEALQKKLSDRLSFYEDLGVRLFYKQRGDLQVQPAAAPATQSFEPQVNPQISYEEAALPKSTRRQELPKPAQTAQRTASPQAARKPDVLPIPAGPSLFEAFDKVPGDTLLKIRSDLGECTRCKLHTTRNKIVFGDGSSKAELVFVGEGPGHDEDMQGLPFVGRAGKLLTQMIEAMGLQRKDVYICNVVKCRPPENRAPEKDEVAAVYEVGSQASFRHFMVFSALGRTDQAHESGFLPARACFLGLDIPSSPDCATFIYPENVRVFACHTKCEMGHVVTPSMS